MQVNNTLFTLEVHFATNVIIALLKYISIFELEPLQRPSWHHPHDVHKIPWRKKTSAPMTAYDLTVFALEVVQQNM